MPRITACLLFLSFSLPVPSEALENRWTFRFVPPPLGIAHEEVRDLAETTDGTVWVATWGGGVYAIRETETRIVNEASGLPGDWVECLEPDKDGGVWIGSGDGLAHIRGEELRVYTPENSPGLETREIVAIHLLKNGDLWVGSEDGRIFSLPQGGNEEAPWELALGSETSGGAPIMDILETSDGAVWAALEGKGTARFDGENWEVFDSIATAATPFSKLFEDREGTLWAAGATRLRRFRGEAWEDDPIWTEKMAAGGFRQAHTYCLEQTSGGNLLVGTWLGLRVQSGPEWHDFEFGSHIGEPQVHSFLIARNNVVWLGTKEGLVQGVPQTWIRHVETDEGNRFLESTLHARPNRPPLCADNAGTVAVLEEEVWRSKYRFPEPVVSLTAPFEETVWALCETMAAKMSLEDGSVLQEVPLPSAEEGGRLFQASAGDLWLLFPSELFVLKGSRFVPHEHDLGYEKGQVLEMDEAEDGTLFVVVGNRVERWKDDSREVLGDRHPELADRHFSSVCCARDGTVWFGTFGEGAIVYEGESVRRLNDEDGLLSNLVSRIYESSEGAMWIAYRRKGVASYHEGRLVNFTHEHGLPNAPILRIGEHPEGTVRLSVRGKGVFRYRPEEGAPETRVNAAPKEIASHGIGVFTFTGMDAWKRTRAEDLAYSWRISPLDEEGAVETPWSPFSGETTVVTPSLPPGSYRFEARAADLDRNVDPTPLTHLFRVAFPLWARPAFFIPMTFLTLIALTLVFALSRNHLALRVSEVALRKSRDELEERVEERTANLHARTTELERAIDEIKTLRGIIPICAGCKKIRDDEGFWSQVEVYVGNRTEADFSHGLCPDCFEEQMKELR